MTSNGRDPLDRLKLVVGYIIVFVWALLFITAIFRPPQNMFLYASVQGALTIVTGGLYATGLWRKGNGNGKK